MDPLHSRLSSIVLGAAAAYPCGSQQPAASQAGGGDGSAPSQVPAWGLVPSQVPLHALDAAPAASGLRGGAGGLSTAPPPLHFPGARRPALAGGLLASLRAEAAGGDAASEGGVSRPVGATTAAAPPGPSAAASRLLDDISRSVASDRVNAGLLAALAAARADAAEREAAAEAAARTRHEEVVGLLVGLRDAVTQGVGQAAATFAAPVASPPRPKRRARAPARRHSPPPVKASASARAPRARRPPPAPAPAPAPPAALCAASLARLPCRGLAALHASVFGVTTRTHNPASLRKALLAGVPLKGEKAVAAGGARAAAPAPAGHPAHPVKASPPAPPSSASADPPPGGGALALLPSAPARVDERAIAHRVAAAVARRAAAAVAVVEA